MAAKVGAGPANGEAEANKDELLKPMDPSGLISTVGKTLSGVVPLPLINITSALDHEGALQGLTVEGFMAKTILSILENPKLNGGFLSQAISRGIREERRCYESNGPPLG